MLHLRIAKEVERRSDKRAGGGGVDSVRVKSLINAALHSLPARLRLSGNGL
jgi:hypothetical protein